MKNHPVVDSMPLCLFLPSSSSAHGRISYSGAVREVSVVMGAFAGWRFFGEKMGSIRLIGSFVIFAGILMVALLG